MKRIFVLINHRLGNSNSPKFERAFKKDTGIRARYLETVQCSQPSVYDATLIDVHPDDMEKMLAIVDGTSILNWNEIDRKAFPRSVINKYHL